MPWRDDRTCLSRRLRKSQLLSTNHLCAKQARLLGEVFERGCSLCISNVLLLVIIDMLYNRIAVLRAERSLSRHALALEVGVNPQTIGFLERGDYTPSLELAFKISRYFKLPVEAVFSPDPFRPLSDQLYELRRREA